MPRAANGRVHHGIATQPRIGFIGLRQMVQQHFAACDISVIRKIGQFLSRRDMQNMRAPPGLAGERHQPTRAKHRGFHIAPFLMVDMRHARREHGLARLQPIFIFRMIANGATAGTHHRFQAFIIFHQQITGGGARKNLDGADIGLKLQSG